MCLFVNAAHQQRLECAVGLSASYCVVIVFAATLHVVSCCCPSGCDLAAGLLGLASGQRKWRWLEWRWSDYTKTLCNWSTLEAFSSWKTLAWQLHHVAVTSPCMKLLVAQSAIFRMLVVRAEPSRNICACWRADFFCVEARRRLRRASATGHCSACLGKRPHHFHLAGDGLPSTARSLPGPPVTLRQLVLCARHSSRRSCFSTPWYRSRSISCPLCGVTVGNTPPGWVGAVIPAGTPLLGQSWLEDLALIGQLVREMVRYLL